MKREGKGVILTNTKKQKRNGCKSMSKTEYIEIIEKALVGNVSPQELQDIVSYYRDYIDMEIKKGRSEQEVLDQLGNPRHLVKSIIAAKEQKNMNIETEKVREEEEKERGRRKSFRIPMALLVIVLLLIVWLALGFVVALVKFALPILLPVAIVMGIMSLIRRLKR